MSASTSKLPKEKIRKSKDKSDKPTKKRKDTAASAQREDNSNGRNEGTDPSLAYQPPAGAEPVDYDVDFGEFDYDAVKADEDAELWLVRVPNNIKPKHLQNLQLSVPSSSRAGRVGVVTRKQTAYDVWALSPEGGGAEHAGVGGEELSALSVLLPRAKKGGKLFLAPKPVKRHLIVAAPPPRATSPESGTPAAQHQTHQDPPRHAYPATQLKHRFLPYGAAKETEELADGMEVEVEDAVALEDSPKRAEEKEKSSTKKRKVEADSPKKRVKKAK
ncbi:hypothetical protein FA95DRAFT_1524893, partial [Auriscalpium vulgare]